MDNKQGAIYSYFHVPFLTIQIVLFIVAAVMRAYYPDAYRHIINRYLFFKTGDEDSPFSKDSLLDEEMKTALTKAYEHPWYKLESSVKFYQEKETLKQNIQKKGTGLLKNEFEHVSQDDVFSERGSLHCES